MTDSLPVALLHGIRLSGAMWRPTSAILGRSRDVRSPDMPGHGALREEPFTVEGCIEAVDRAIAEVGGRALLAGVSMGGYLALAAGARIGQPRIAGIVAIGCTAKPGTRAGVVYSAAAALAQRAPDRYDRATERAMRRMVPPELSDAVMEGGFATASFGDAVREITALDSLSDVAAYGGPTWFLNGTFDQMRLHEKQFLAAAPQGRLTVWPGKNHLTVLSDPQRLATFIDDACRVIERDPAPE
ncbi:alpha/beta fold hydrolase [Blastococcus sp. Marseille-P5729]|uniref:alpha/beta fold hydrolase n=1 Tax=Blastococcus sp. Marseille-P5729 TaxID=2086582 RepID=UPI000D0F7DDE|nr:alpha/beta hydrolase [Blastococcus sp. Marseille-P5729]